MHSTAKLLSDEELAAKYNDSEKCAAELISRYVKVIWIKAQNTTTASVDKEDLIQEGMLGLLNAIRTYDECKSKFSTYADRCIENKMLSAIRKESIAPLLSSEGVEMNEKLDNDTPESIFLEKENELELDDRVSSHLSEMEMQIFKLILNGSTYNQVADELKITVKTVDNALQRVRKKLKTVWNEKKE